MKERGKDTRDFEGLYGKIKSDKIASQFEDAAKKMIGRPMKVYVNDQEKYITPKTEYEINYTFSQMVVNHLERKKISPDKKISADELADEVRARIIIELD